MDLKLLRDIKDTEDKAKQILENAENKKIELIESAKTISIKRYEDFLRRIEQKKEGLLVDRRLEIRRQKKLIMTASEKGIERLKNRVLSNVEKAMNFIIEIFKRAV